MLDSIFVPSAKLINVLTAAHFVRLLRTRHVFEQAGSATAVPDFVKSHPIRDRLVCGAKRSGNALSRWTLRGNGRNLPAHANDEDAKAGSSQE
jgi:hypothetical protein